MTGHISFCFLLFLTGCCDCTLPRTIPSPARRDANAYCRICANHTMCRFPYDTDGARCVKLEHADLDEKDIAMIIDCHNVYRNTVANGDEQRGNPGPQRPAKHMMELIWDDELAHIARRWAVQCNLLEKDQCRDVERFDVWQNVHVLDMNSVGNVTSSARIHFHIQSWYDEVEDFDSAEFGFVNFTARANLSYIPFASSTISQVGCGRAIYTGRAAQSGSTDVDTATTGRTMAVGFGARVEALVCNYGPLDRNTPGELYEDGVPALCPSGTIRSSRYRALCQTFTNGLNSNLPGRKPRVAERSAYGPRGPGHMSQIPDLEENPRRYQMRYRGQYAPTIIRRGPGKSAPRAQRTSGGLKTKFLIGYNQ